MSVEQTAHSQRTSPVEGKQYYDIEADEKLDSDKIALSDEEQSLDSPNDEKQNSLDGQKPKPSIAEQLPLWREAIFVLLAILAQLCTQISLGQTVSIIHIIGSSFGVTDPGILSWLIAGYSLTVGTFILISGRFGDVFGHKKMLMIAFSWFSLWSMVSGLSVYSNYVLFIFSRVLAGIGPSIALPNALAILGISYNPGIRKNMVFALFGAVAPIGGVLGATFGGLFALVWWPWTYWTLSIFLAVVVVLDYFFIPDVPREAQDRSNFTFYDRLQEIDFFGGAVGVTALILINFAWNQAPVVSWSEPYVYVSLIVGILLLPAFFYIETRIARFPLIPFDALNFDVAMVLACVACGWGTFGLWYYYYFQFVEELRGGSPLLVAAYQSPAAISGACASLATGFLLAKLRPAWVMVIALTCFSIGVILLANMPVNANYWTYLFFSTVITPWGMDMSFPSATLILSNSVSKENQGIAASLVNTVVNYSISTALGVAGTVGVSVSGGKMTPDALLKSYRSAWYLGIGLSVTGLMISIVFVIKSYANDRRKA